MLRAGNDPPFVAVPLEHAAWSRAVGGFARQRVDDGFAACAQQRHLRGYHYYTGATFSVFATDAGGAVIDCGRGGRYDGVGRAFGRARPATGFTLDLRRLAALVGERGATDVIIAPDDPDPALARQVASLRAQGEAVVVALPGEAAARAATGRALERHGNEWRVIAR